MEGGLKCGILAPRAEKSSACCNDGPGVQLLCKRPLLGSAAGWGPAGAVRAASAPWSDPEEEMCSSSHWSARQAEPGLLA